LLARKHLVTRYEGRCGLVASERFPMPSYLPIELEQFIDPASAYSTLRNLTAAAEAGTISLSAVATYVRAVERGEAIRFSKTRAIPLAMKEMIELRKDLPPRQVIYKGLAENLWSEEDVEAWENNQATLSEARHRPAPRGVYLTRGRRTRPKKPRTEGMFVPKMSLDAVCSFQISDGAKTCLAIILSLAGKSNTVTTYTASIAKRMGRTPRTVRNHFIALEAAGLIVRTPGRDPNTVKITINSICRPEAYREPDDVRAYKLARRSGNPALQLLAFTAASAAMEVFKEEFRLPEGRKEISSFNPESISFLLRPEATATSSSPKPTRQIGPTTYSDFHRPHPPRGIQRIASNGIQYKRSAPAMTSALSRAINETNHGTVYGGYGS
jgi:hypothetical protein